MAATDNQPVSVGNVAAALDIETDGTMDGRPVSVVNLKAVLDSTFGSGDYLKVVSLWTGNLACDYDTSLTVDTGGIDYLFYRVLINNPLGTDFKNGHLYFDLNSLKRLVLYYMDPVQHREISQTFSISKKGSNVVFDISDNSNRMTVKSVDGIIVASA